MIVCPVCEHPQSVGSECEVCGRRLARAAGADPGVAPMEGLEVTHHAAVDAAGELVPDLEPTGHLAVQVQEEAPVEIEPTCAAPVDVATELTPDLERTHAEIPGDGPTPLPAVIVCRYCRTPAPAGEHICSRCGMRLPVLGASAARGGEQPPRLCSCGLPVRGSLCPSCGARSGGDV
jgi:hypothetical protein